MQDGSVWEENNLEITLISYVILKFVFIILSLTLPLPNGIFAPVISFGAVFGRLYGHAIDLIGNSIGI